MRPLLPVFTRMSLAVQGKEPARRSDFHERELKLAQGFFPSGMWDAISPTDSGIAECYETERYMHYCTEEERLQEELLRKPTRR